METANMILLLVIKINDTLRRQINKLRNKLILELDGLNFIRFEIQCVCYCSLGGVHCGCGWGCFPRTSGIAIWQSNLLLCLFVEIRKNEFARCLMEGYEIRSNQDSE